MKKIAVIVLILVMSPNLFADQLAYLSKKDADRGAEVIERAKKIGLFCGCCDNDKNKIVKISGVEVKHTGYENYFEIFVMYKEHGENKSVPVDLAYVWIKSKGKIQTVGQVLGLQHDPCKTPVW